MKGRKIHSYYNKNTGEYRVYHFHPMECLIYSDGLNMWRVKYEIDSRTFIAKHIFSKKSEAMIFVQNFFRTVIAEERLKLNDISQFDNSSNISIIDNSKISKQQALEILGLNENPSNDEINQAFRKLITKVHPDTGGTKFMAILVNKAKEILMTK